VQLKSINDLGDLAGTSVGSVRNPSPSHREQKHNIILPTVNVVAAAEPGWSDSSQPGANSSRQLELLATGRSSMTDSRLVDVELGNLRSCVRDICQRDL
jgi:hypothetical protein